jgi:hypothetical protein
MKNHNTIPSRGRSSINATKAIVTLLGVLTGIGGCIHGILEAFQGNHSTNSLIINALGVGNSWTLWKSGGEGAFTLIPNFLATGTLAIITAIALAVWSVRFIDRVKGPSIFLILGACLFLVGGGVAQVPFIILTWAISTRINKPLNWWKTFLSEDIRRTIAKLWMELLVVFSLMFAVAFEISIFGFFPNVSNPYTLNLICWVTLAFSAVVLVFSVVAGFANDIQQAVK